MANNNDRAAQAVELMDMALEFVTGDDRGVHFEAEAQMLATLELARQQRIANFIALASHGTPRSVHSYGKLHSGVLAELTALEESL